MRQKFFLIFNHVSDTWIIIMQNDRQKRLHYLNHKNLQNFEKILLHKNLQNSSALFKITITITTLSRLYLDFAIICYKNVQNSKKNSLHNLSVLFSIQQKKKFLKNYSNKNLQKISKRLIRQSHLGPQLLQYIIITVVTRIRISDLYSRIGGENVMQTISSGGRLFQSERGCGPQEPFSFRKYLA